MIELAITADDFTGALDTAVQFSRNSTGTAVMFYNDLDFSGISGEVRVVVIDTESRHVSPEEAASRVKEAVTKARACGVTHFYKKTDSVLRGNIGSELMAIMEAAGSRDLMFVPAYPDMGRTTREGRQYLNGVQLNETSFAKDPIDPVSDCDIANIIKKQADAEIITVGRNERPDLANGYEPGGPMDAGKKEDPHNLNDTNNPYEPNNADEPYSPGEPGGRGPAGRPAGRSMSRSAGRIYVFDAESNKDLKNIAGLLKAEGKLKLTAGCAGFAGVLPETLELCIPWESDRANCLAKDPAGSVTEAPAGYPAKSPEVTASKASASVADGKSTGRMLTVCGSVNEISLRQVRFAEENGFCRITPEPGQLLTPGYFETEAGSDFVERTARLISGGKDVIISAAASQADRENFCRFAREKKIDEDEIPFIISHGIAELVHKIADIAHPGIFTVVGGDTAVAIAYSMGFSSVIPRYDIEKGVVLSEAFGYGDGIILITKSGGFGNEDILVKVRDCMKNG